MKIAIMQPYFFPYLGYFDLINSVDLFIVYDTVQYIRRGWIHRNRILRQDGKGWQYVVVPTVKAPQKTRVTDIAVATDSAWKTRILGQMDHYRTTAPHAKDTIRFVGECLASNESSVARLNVHLLARCSDLLAIDFRYRFASDLDVQLDATRTAEERILDLCEYLGAKEYVNLPGGIDLYHPEAFAARNIRLTFRHLPKFFYATDPYVFEPNLSIIDVLMWNEPGTIKAHLDANRSQEVLGG